MNRLALLLIAAISLTATALGQQAGSPPASPSASASEIKLTPDDLQELRAARSAALKANPDIAAKHQKLLERMRLFESKLDAAMIKADPSIAPIIAKFEANLRPAGAPAAPPPAK